MKRILQYALATGALGTLLFSCMDFNNLKTPERIVISPGDGEYSLPGGSYSISVDDYLSAEKLQRQINKLVPNENSSSKFSLGEDLQVYEWNPNKRATYHQFIIEYPIMDYKLDFEKYIEPLTKLLSGEGSGTNSSGEEDSLGTPIPIPGNLRKTTKTITGLTLPNLSGQILEKIKTIKPSDDFKFTIPEYTYTTEVSSRKLLRYSDEEAKPDTTDADLITLTTDNTSFSSITFSGGYMKIAIKETLFGTTGAGYSLAFKAQLCDENFTLLSENSQSETVTFTGQNDVTKTLYIPLTGYELPPKIRVLLTGTYSASTANVITAHTYKIAEVGFSDGTESMENPQKTNLKEINELTTTPISFDTTNLNFSTEDALAGDNDFIEKATILKGSLEIAGELPDGWKNVIAEVAMSVDGAITIDPIADHADLDRYFIHKYNDLSNTTVSCNEKLNVTAESAQLVFENATIVLNDDGSTPNAKDITCTALIETVGNAEVKIAKLKSLIGDLSKTIYQDIDTDITNYVETAKIIELNLLGKIKNELDFNALWVQPKLASEAFYLSADTEVDYINIMEDGTTFGITRKSPSWSGVTLDFTESGLAKFPKNPTTNKSAFDFTISLDIRGDGYDKNNPSDYDASEDRVTLNSVELGKTYYIKPEFTSFDDDTHMIECEEVVLKLSDDLIPEDSINTGLNIGELFDGLMDDDGSDSEKTQIIKDIVDAVEFTGIKGYIYVTAPQLDDNPLEGLDITGQIDALGGDDAENLSKIDTLLAEQELAIIYDSPTISSYANAKNVITAPETTLFADGTYSAETSTICSIINQKPNNLTFHYKIGLGNSSGKITLDRKAINALQDLAKKQTTQENEAESEDGEEVVSNTSTNLSMSIALYVPMKLKITKDVMIDDVIKFAKGEESTDDLLGRDSDADLDDYTKYADLIDYVECSYLFAHSTGLDLEATLMGDGITTKTLHFNGTKDSFKFTSTDVNNILQTNPFIPKISVTLKKADEVMLTRTVNGNPSFKMSLGVTVATNPDGEYELWKK